MSSIIKDIKLTGGDNIELADTDTDEDDEIIIYEGIYSAVDSPQLKVYNVIRPMNYTEAMALPQATYWQKAMEDQHERLIQMKAWDIINKPAKVTRILPGKWVYTFKTDKDNYITTYKARWVVYGNFQQPGHDFDATYSPVISEVGVKLVLSLISIKKLCVEQVDYIMAYLYAKLRDYNIYMTLPTRFIVNSKVAYLL